MQAVVLAAGEGQRLRPFTANKPKVMIKVANKPILEFVVESLRDAGVLDIIMVVGYRSSRIMDYFGNGKDWNVRIEYAIQKQQIGTAHALKQAEDLIRDDEFLVISGDNIIDAKTIEKVKEPWTLAYKVSEEPSKYGVIELSNGKVKRIIEKPDRPISNLINTGVYCFGKDVFEFIDVPDLVSVINRMIESGYEFKCVEAELWMDIVYPWDILKVNDLAMNFSGKTLSGKVEDSIVIGDVIVGRNTIIRGNSYIRGPVIFGDNCEVGPNAVIMPSTSIGDNVRIGAFCYLENCVIGDNVTIAPNCHLVDCVIDDGCIVGPNTSVISGDAEIKVGKEHHYIKAGAFLGESCEIGANVVMDAGTILGNNVKVTHLKFVRGVIPDSSTIL